MAGLFEVEEKDRKYSHFAGKPQYEPTREDCPRLDELYNKDKMLELLTAIRNSGISDEEKDFLRLAASRHIKFRFDQIAEYYCHASAEMQRLMEKSALVIPDFDDAIAEGYVKLTEKLQNIVEKNQK